MSDPIATMSGVQSRLDGLSAKLDALAERKGGKAKDLTVKVVKVITAHKVSGHGLIWFVERDNSKSLRHPGLLEQRDARRQRHGGDGHRDDLDAGATRGSPC